LLRSHTGGRVPAQKATDEQILSALNAAKGVRAEAARQLGINTRALSQRIDGLKSRGVPVPDSTYDPAARFRTANGVVESAPRKRLVPARTPLPRREN
jgi:hypothetical protein